jgi:hypothetical protein
VIGASRFMLLFFSSFKVFGHQGLIETALPQITIFGVAAVLGMGLGLPFASLALVPAFAYSIFRGNNKLEKINAEIKTKASDEFCKEFQQQATERAEAFGDHVHDQISILRISCDKYFRAEIAALREQVITAKEERKRGATAIELKIQELESARDRLDKIDGQLIKLVAECAVGHSASEVVATGG